MSSSTTRKNTPQKRNTTRKIDLVNKLRKCPRSRISGMESYKINCGKNLLLGYHNTHLWTFKIPTTSVVMSDIGDTDWVFDTPNCERAAEETSIHKDDFVHVALSSLQDYTKPVVVKVYDEDNFHLHIERNILKIINGYRNTAQLICEFSCNDNKPLRSLRENAQSNGSIPLITARESGALNAQWCKNRYLTKITKQIKFCGNGTNRLHFFVYEYIAHGDISEFLTKNQDSNIIQSFILQITCVIIQLASIYKIYHGDINTGNILIDSTNETTIDYCIEGESIRIESHGIIPKIIDYGRSNFYKGTISNNEVWFDIILALGVMYPYIKNDIIKHKLFDISKKTELVFSSLKEYYFFIRDAIHI